MAKSKSDNMLVYVLYLFLFLTFLAGIYVCFSYGLQVLNTNSPAAYDPTPASSAISAAIIQTPATKPILIKNAAGSSPAISPATNPMSCPNMLVRRGNQLFMYNTNLPQEPGVNPILFNTLDDYIYYVKVQRYKYGNDCPVLYLQEETDAQGNDVYRVRPGPFDTQGGMQISQDFPIGTVLPQLPVTYPSLPVNAMVPPNYMAPNLENMGGYSIPPFSINPISSNNVTMNTLTAQGQFVPPVGLPPISPTPEANVTGSRPTTFPSNLSSKQAAPQDNFYTGVSPMITNALIMTPNAFNKTSIPSMNTPVPTLINAQNSTGPSTITQYTDASRENPPYNQGGYAGFDPKNQYTGTFTNLDAVHNSTLYANPKYGLSDNPMDPNWGGVLFTRAQVNSGKYDDNIVTKPVYSGAPNVLMNPNSLVPLVKPIPNNPIIAQDTKIKKSSPENA
jgi:hypothetical protein